MTVSNTMRSALLVLLVALSTSPLLADEIVIDPNVTGTVTIPEGDFARIDGTYTLNNALIDVYGQIISERFTIVMTGSGEVMLNAPVGRWNYGCCGTNSVTIESGISVLGQRGTSYASKGTVNRGTFAAVAGGSSFSDFRILANHGFVNEGLMEARDGGELHVLGATPATFGSGSLLRAQPGGTLKVSGTAFNSLADLGTIENLGGTIEIYGAELANSGQTTTFSGGQWSLLSGTEVYGGTLATDMGGDLTIGPEGSFTFQQSNPVEFHEVTLASDLRLTSGARLEVFDELNLDDASVRMQGGTTYMYLFAAAPLVGTGAIVSEGPARLALKLAAELCKRGRTLIFSHSRALFHCCSVADSRLRFMISRATSWPLREHFRKALN